MERFYLVTAAVLFGVLASGCREDNPAYVGKIEPPDSSVQEDAKVEPLGGDADVTESGDAPADTLEEDSPKPLGDGGLDVVGPGIDGSHAVDGETVDVVAQDARDAGEPEDGALDRGVDVVQVGDVSRDLVLVPDGPDRLDGPPVLPDGRRDGAGDSGSVGPDLAPACQEQQTRTCVSPDNPLIGACRAGKQICTSGAWGACKEEVLPAVTEACNGIDDDCDGMTDEGCAEACVVVAPSGDDATADGTAAKPFASLHAALALASAVDAGAAPRRVCVAGGGSCAESFAYAQDSSLSIPSGAKVQGNYALAEGVLSYCPEAQAPTTTLKFEVAGTSVELATAGTAATEVGGFVIARFSDSTGAAADSPGVGVLVSGARNVLLSRIFIVDAPVGDRTYGVLVDNGGQTTIVRSSINGGLGKMAAIGVAVSKGSVVLRNNCDVVKGGNCLVTCAGGSGMLGIRGRASDLDGALDTSAVYVGAEAGAASTIATSMLCGGVGTGDGNVLDANVAALRCEGGGCGGVKGNHIAAGGGKHSVAAAISSGAAALDSNAIVAGCGVESTAGVVLSMSAASLTNNRIQGSACNAETSAGAFFGVRVVHGAGTGELVIHSNDIDPMGNGEECESVGVSFERVSGDGGGPSGILRNNIVAAGNCKRRVSVSESANASVRVIENNDLYPGLLSPSGASTALYLRGGADVTSIDQVNKLAGAAGNISANPKFVSYPGDLHLTGESPCIDKGTAAGAPAADGDALARPQGDGFDIGAFEYVGSL